VRRKESFHIYLLLLSYQPEIYTGIKTPNFVFVQRRHFQTRAKMGKCSSPMEKVTGVPRNFFRAWGVQQIQLRTGSRKKGNLGAVAPWSGVPLNLQMSETRILIRLLQMDFPRNWEFGSALSKLRNFEGSLNSPILPLPSPPPRYDTGKGR
jgi:hypothetical protein